LIDAADEFLAEARRERGARTIDHIGDALRPACPNAASMSPAMRKAASRKGSSASRAPPGGTMA